MFLDIFLLVFSIVLLFGGIIGCILPVIPGPPLSYIALLLLNFTRFAGFTPAFLWIAAGITIVITVLDYILPAMGTKNLGGSRAGTIGSILGMIVGIFIIPPWGIIVGSFAGAFVGELIIGRDTNSALKSGLGSFIGFVFGTLAKFVICIVFAYYYFKEIICYFISL
jgi:uncharacterized protein YqgC (DUF456 family)